ncbi:A-kinase anchor protein 17A isoform X2 [Ochotona curzoniae]|uniref:A-kinase anchor protein 17A isoform X2 n=1 Tax=Ochotona curzoniae TaxID=130825 RepID=UPI001B3499AF|nr:A-kinase anchor protein 17A isoform X2 [Ochotona curzoniae]
MSAGSIVHDASEAEPLCPAQGLFLQRVSRLSISVALPAGTTTGAGRGASTWEVMERLKALAQAQPLSALRVARSAPELVRLEAEVENRALARALLHRLDGQTLRLAGCAQALRVRADECPPRPLPTTLDDGDERPDTLHLQGLPCRWFAPRPGRHDSGAHVAGRDAATVGAAGPAHTGSAGTGSDAAQTAPGSDTAGSGSDSTGSSSALTKTGSATTGGGCGLSGSGSAPSGSASNSSAITCSIPGNDPTSTGTPSSPMGSDCAMTGSRGTPMGSGPSRRETRPVDERPSEEVLARVFSCFGEVRRVDIPMLDPYRQESPRAVGVAGVVGGASGPLHFEAFVQYREHAGFLRAMAALRGARLLFRGDDGKAVACHFKVTSDATQHLSDASVRRRQLERQKLQELERQRAAQKRRELEEEERRQREQQARARQRRREEKRRRREERERGRARRRGRRRLQRLQAEERRVRLEERRLLLAQRSLQALRLVGALLGRAEASRVSQEAGRRRLQEAELRRVEAEQARALGLQRQERELRRRLLAALLGPGGGADAAGSTPLLDVLRRVKARHDPAMNTPAVTPTVMSSVTSSPLPERRGRRHRSRSRSREGQGRR